MCFTLSQVHEKDDKPFLPKMHFGHFPREYHIHMYMMYFVWPKGEFHEGEPMLCSWEVPQSVNTNSITPNLLGAVLYERS